MVRGWCTARPGSAAVEAAPVLHRLRNVRRAGALGTGQIRQRARHAQHRMIRPHRQPQPLPGFDDLKVTVAATVRLKPVPFRPVTRHA